MRSFTENTKESPRDLNGLAALVLVPATLYTVTALAWTTFTRDAELELLGGVTYLGRSIMVLGAFVGMLGMVMTHIVARKVTVATYSRMRAACYLFLGTLAVAMGQEVHLFAYNVMGFFVIMIGLLAYARTPVVLKRMGLGEGALYMYGLYVLWTILLPVMLS